MRDIGRFLEAEESFHQGDRQQARKERKQAQELDRSKYKKTDQNKERPIKAPPPGTLRGHVLGIYPEGIQVLANSTVYRCQLRGTLKKEKTRHKNLITVGDFVFLEPKNQGEGMICFVEPRRSVLSRADNLLRRKEQLIAANIDQVVITASVVSPPLKPFLLDRYIIAAQKGQMAPIIVINKVDLLKDQAEEKQLADLCKEAYTSLSIPCLFISTLTGEGLHELKTLMEGKSSVFSGQSGTGKSSLINAISHSSLKTGQITGKTQKGAHTTTTTLLIPLDNGGFCVDTPGIRSFGVWGLSQEEIKTYFPEIQEIGISCKFTCCSHRQEPDCAVKQAVEEGRISPVRFASYLALLDTLEEEHRTR
ncbi:MAG: ribosome small subunit-dependent GTPase A [Chlamydiae bacterium]|nr:ribosome small subunit-dependent GTPase A [Chlamydiota bacterium]